jgi:hypothetical protein
MDRAAVAVVLLVALATPAAGLEREQRLRVHWNGTIPEARPTHDGKPPLPVLVYVHPTTPTRDAKRFEGVTLHNESALLAMKFFCTVKMPEDVARKHPLLAGMRFKTPALIAFDSTRTKSAVAPGRTSAMKIYGLLCRVAQADYETSLAKTVRDARNLLATFDQIDAARDALTIKKSRAAEAAADGKGARARKLEQEIVADQAEIDRMLEKAEKRWTEIWDLKRKKRQD